MVENKYPKYVTTDSDLWNSADEAYFFVIKGEAKPLSSLITPIIDDALESGLLREATTQEIEEYLLEQDIEKKIIEGRFNRGRTYEDTKGNYIKWKESYEKNNTTYKNPQKITKPVINRELTKPIVTEKPTLPKEVTPTENALNQKASVRSDNM